MAETAEQVKAEHTPLPWVARECVALCCIEIIAPGQPDRLVVMVDDCLPTDRANTDLIARACNSYAALRQAVVQFKKFHDLLTGPRSADEVSGAELATLYVENANALALVDSLEPMEPNNG